MIKPQYTQAVKTFQHHLYLKDPTPVLIVAAAVVANLAPGDPVWPMLVAPPSTMKTELLRTLYGLDYVYPTSTITEAALLSGTAQKEWVEGAKGGILKEIGEFGILVCKDFTSVLAQNRETSKAPLPHCERFMTARGFGRSAPVAVRN